MKIKLVLQLGLTVRSWADVAVQLEAAAATLRNRHRAAAEPEHGEDTPLYADNGNRIGILAVVTDKEM